MNQTAVVSFAAMISGCLTYRKIFREIFNWFFEGTSIVECIANDTRGRSISDFQCFAHFETSIRRVNCFYILTEAVVGFAKGQVALIFALLVYHGCFDNKSYLAAPDRPFILHKYIANLSLTEYGYLLLLTWTNCFEGFFAIFQGCCVISKMEVIA